MKITRLVLRNYRGVESREIAVGSGGALISGDNAVGKTSCLRALRAALEAVDVAPDAIRNGADRAEILVDMDHVSVRRVIGANGHSVSVTTADGMVRTKPQTWLDEIFGTTPDALAIMQADEKKRRQIIMAATPMRTSVEELRTWAPDLPAETDVSGHAIDVIARVRKWYYDKRHAKNAEAKTARAEADRLLAAVPEIDGPANGGPTVGEAQRALAGAKADLADAESRRRNADDHARKTAGLRDRIEAHRETANHERPGKSELEARAAEASDAIDAVQRLEQQLADARVTLESARRRLQQTQARHKLADDEDRKAADLEAMLGATAPAGATDNELSDANARCAGAELTAMLAEQRARYQEAVTIATAAVTKAAETDGAAASLDATVRALTDDAPQAMLAAAGSIPGLGMDGDRITLDGVALDGLSGRERMRFAIQIAKRANADRKLKLLVVDGLEQLAPARQEEFVQEATADGWQLLATRVADGELIVEAIERHDAGASGTQEASIP